uniref:G-protein coupled receptors family 1 profile domain-containing protein n=1 Tax=Anopheles culicifacies TaxID=139723 RepID=A0A182MMQ8_9DIPT
MVSENYTQLLLDASNRFNLSAYSTVAGPTMSHDEELETEMMVSTIVAIFFGFIGITGLLGNALVVLVVLSNPQMRSTTNLLIINLAIADLLFVVFCVPFTATDYVLASWPFGDLWCKSVQYLIVVTAHASIYTLVLMSLDRFLAVVHPIASMVIRTEKNTVLAITILWVLIITTGLPVSFAHGININKTDALKRADGWAALCHLVWHGTKCFWGLEAAINQPLIRNGAVVCHERYECAIYRPPKTASSKGTAWIAATK